MPVLAPDHNITVPNTFVAPNLNHGWNVILHNDNTVYAGDVVEALQVVMGYSYEMAESIMMEAHQQGKASVIVTTESMAKHYQDRLQQYDLTITIEKV